MFVNDEAFYKEFDPIQYANSVNAERSNNGYLVDLNMQEAATQAESYEPTEAEVSQAPLDYIIRLV